MKFSKRSFLFCALFVGLVFAANNETAHAVPPIVASDVPTADKGVGEIFLGMRYRDTGSIQRQIPFGEVVLGISRWQEVTFEIPYLSLNPSGGGSQQGFGDAVLGTKAMFLRETAARPGMALSFEVKLPNANRQRGQGSGAVDYDLRLRTQKTWDWFAGLWNVGYTIVGEPTVNGVRQDMRNVMFLAFAQEYKIAPKTKLISEVYWKNSDTPGGPGRLAGDIGFKHNFSPLVQIQFAVGKSFRAGSIGGPRLRVYSGIKLEFFVFKHDQR